MPAARMTHLGKLIALSILLAFPTVISAQTRDLPVQIKDLGGPDSPITATGQVVFHEVLSPGSVKQQHDVSLEVTNASSKTIAAYEVSLEATSDYGGGFNHVYKVDHFFRAQLQFVPGARENLSFSHPSWSVASRGKGGPAIPHASFKVLFVEFADGSKFGTSHWAAALAGNRQRSVQRMQEIEEAYATSGEAGLRSALAAAQGRQDDPQDTLAVMGQFKVTLDSKGPDAAGNEIREFLAVAQTRKDIM